VTIPHWLWVALAWILGVGPVATLLLWGVIWLRLEQTMRSVPTLRLGEKLAAADPPTGRVCVVVPAYNESRVIAGLVRSLRGETYPQLRFVLALDRCTDDTAALARAEIADDDRFEIIEIEACPDDWVGKVHALHTAVIRSRAAPEAEFLLFADADTLFAPGCIASALALMRERRLSLLSLLSTLTHDTWFERVVQTATALELMRRYPLTLANAERDPRAFANGQFLLFRRNAYEAIGGHEAVRDVVFEDVNLARLVVTGKGRTGVFMADGLFRCRMYADWAQFRRGWKRIFTETASRRARRLAVWSWQIRLLGAIFPVWTLAALAFGGALIAQDALRGWSMVGFCVVALLVWAGALVRIAMTAHAPLWTAPLHIAGAWLTADLLAEAARDVRAQTPTRWGGREYDLRLGKPE
jgi:cellulose synthase/poly-beta-1,6-N-acetylglucosamine synthase-like glycosyltransferase